MPIKGLLERLRDKEDVIVAEGYLFELERRGYLKAGAFVPDVVIEYPDIVKGLHEEFVHAGSDVVLALTFYTHRAKLRDVGLENDSERINRAALKIARDVADRTKTLMAGNICNTTIYESNKPETYEMTREMLKEQIEWAVEEKADFIVGETFFDLGEAMFALEAIKSYGKGLPAVITMSVPRSDMKTGDGIYFTEALRKLEDAGADVVGLNCARGPATMLPMLEEARRVCKGPLAALPVPYRTREGQHNFFTLKDPDSGNKVFPINLPALASLRTEITDFGRKAKQLGIQYAGLCCGNASHYLREIAEAYGRKTPASRYSPDMSQHFIFGSDPTFTKSFTEDIREKILS